MEKKRLLTAIITLVVGLFAITQTALAAGPYYFRTTGADPKKPSDWTPNANGIGGTSPVSLGGANIVWNFYNSTGAVTGTCSGNMVLGNGATLNIGNGNADRLNFGAFTVNKAATVHANATVTSSNTNPGFMGAGNFTYNVASTAIFSANNVTVPAPGASTPYGNLTLSGTSATLGAHVIVNGTFTANALVFNGQQLDLNGTVASIGTITGDAGATFNLNGTGSVSITMDQTTPGTTNVFNTLYYNSAGGTLSLTNALNIYPGGTITPAAGTIDVTTSGGSLILLADQVAIGNTGAVGTIGGSFVATSITSQVYHDPTGNQTDWTLLGSPGISGADFTQWNTTFPITCPSCPNGCCVAGTGFTSITSYIENLGSVYTDNAHYVGINNTTDAMTIGQGWWVYMGKSSPSTATAGELIVVSGTPNQGAFSYNVTSTAQGSGYNLLANPYPSPVSWTSVYNNNAGNLSSSSYATWSPNYGGYVYYDGFTNTPNPSGTSYDLSDVVPISMGFYIQSSNGTAISFAETDKTQGTQPLLRQSSSSVANTTHVKCTVSASGSTGASEATVVFNASSTAGLDNFIDTKRFAGNSGRLEVSCPVGGFDLAINGMPALTQNYHIPVKMVTGGAGTTGTFSIGAKNLKYMPSGACIMLHDNYTNANYDLRNGPYNITLNDTENVARFVLNVSTATLSLTGSAKQA
ncbi:MAG TPA: hypothetical protein VNY73_08240, partial [Bacteroidia bacterium]|nr:hypothetical protein [Bacteroidia bacterium]